jgi:hypothetical protein
MVLFFFPFLTYMARRKMTKKKEKESLLGKLHINKLILIHDYGDRKNKKKLYTIGCT